MPIAARRSPSPSRPPRSQNARRSRTIDRAGLRWPREPRVEESNDDHKQQQTQYERHGWPPYAYPGRFFPRARANATSYRGYNGTPTLPAESMTSTGVPADIPVRYFQAGDGAQLAYREMGEGRPLVLIHGYFSTAFVNWVRYGHAAALAAHGHRVIMPDLRGHGDSAKPHAAAAYPPDVLTDDGFALIHHLGLTDYDLGGYSLGGRTTVRMLVRGAMPGRAIVAGMGLDGIVHSGGRSAFFRRILTQLGTFERGSLEWMTEAFLKTVGGDPMALIHILATFVDTPIEDVAQIRTPTLVLKGAEDHDNGSAEGLAAALPNGKYVSVPGNHMSAVTKSELGAAVAEFLGG
jgi:pimeloyl-ACP methyl ester carboxylesterase